MVCFFAAEWTFQAFSPHLEKARSLLGYDLEWKTECGKQAARGLARAGGGIHEPKPAVAKSFFFEDVRQQSAIGRFCAGGLGRLTLLIGSLCLTLVRQVPREKMGADSVFALPSVIGLGKGGPVIRFRGKEDSAGGSRTIRRCICEKYPFASLEISTPQIFRPVCSF